MLNAQISPTNLEINPKIHRALCGLVQAEHIRYAPNMQALLHNIFDMLLLEPGDNLIASALSDGVIEEVAQDLGLNIDYCDCAPGSLDMDPLALYDLKGSSYDALFVCIHNASTPNLERYNAMKPLIAATRAARIPVIAYAPDALGSHFHGKPLAELCDYALYTLRAENGSELCFCASHKSPSGLISAPSIQALEQEFQSASASCAHENKLLTAQDEEILKHRLKYFAHVDELQCKLYNLVREYLLDNLPGKLEVSIAELEESWAKKSPARLVLRIQQLSDQAHASMLLAIQEWMHQERAQDFTPPLSSCIKLCAQEQASSYPNAHTMARETIVLRLNEAITEESFDAASIKESLERLTCMLEDTVIRLNDAHELIYTSEQTKIDDRLNAYIKHMDKENLWVSPHAFYANRSQALEDDDDNTIL